MDLIGALDQSMSLTLAFILPHYSFMEFVMKVLSFEGATVLLWVVVLCLLVTWEYLSRPSHAVFLVNLAKVVLTLVCTLSLAGITVHYIIKPIVARERPFVALNVEAPSCPRDYSFPSGHAALAFAGAYVLSRFDRDLRRRILYFLLALGISYSRVYLLCHYAGDVFMGGVYGVITGFLCYDSIQYLYTHVLSRGSVPHKE